MRQTGSWCNRALRVRRPSTTKIIFTDCQPEGEKSCSAAIRIRDFISADIRLPLLAHLSLGKEKFHCGEPEAQTIANTDVVQELVRHPPANGLWTEACKPCHLVCSEKEVGIVPVEEALHYPHSTPSFLRWIALDTVSDRSVVCYWLE